MSDLISRTALLVAIDRERETLIERGLLGGEHVVVHHARRLIEEAPSVDTVPVVRCKNCMYWVETGEGIGECERFEVADSDPEITHAYQTAHDWFCADGEQADSTTCGPDYCEIGGGDK